jgi:hypothetical protein
MLGGPRRQQLWFFKKSGQTDKYTNTQTHKADRPVGYFTYYFGAQAVFQSDL